jgi:hypothetical protein
VIFDVENSNALNTLADYRRVEILVRIISVSSNMTMGYFARFISSHCQFTLEQAG